MYVVLLLGLDKNTRPFTLWKVTIGRFSNREWAEMVQNAAFSRIYYWKSDYWSLFKEEMSENCAEYIISAILLLEKWSLVDFQIGNERKLCRIHNFRGFTIGKVIICWFSNRKWAKTAQNIQFPRFYYWKIDHLLIFK